ncbi:MAG: Cytochrome biosis protein, partial [Thermodesulfobacteriota bacterium]|nr:Cytochrome biosis protein [Thermodesulfobacteriota bacterium]
MAVQLGYKNIYRDPKGFPEWQKMGLPVESVSIKATETAETASAQGPL